MLKKVGFLFVSFIYLNNLLAEGNAELNLNKVAKMPLDSNQVKEWIRLLDQNNITNKALAIEYGQTGLRLAQKIEWLPGIAVTHEKIGRIYWNSGKYPLALYHHGNALRIFKQLDYWKDYWDVMVMIGQDYANYTQYDKSLLFLNLALHEYKVKKVDGGVAYVLGILSWVYAAKGDYVLASQNIFEQIKIVEQSGDSNSLINVYLSLASNYINLEKPQVAENIIDTWQPIIQKSKDPNGLMDYYTLKASILKYRNQFDSAVWCYEHEKAIAKSIHNNYWIADAFVSIGNVYYEKHDYNQALANYDSAYYYFKSYNQTKELGSLAGKICICMLKNGRIKEAKKYINEAKSHTHSFDSPAAKLEYYFAKYLYDSAAMDWQSAFYHLNLYETLKDSLFNKSRTQQLLELQIRHETEKREELLQNEKETRGIILIILAIITIGLTALYFQLKRNNKRIKQSNQIQRTMLNEIHHRVKNNLQLISGFMQLQLMKTTDIKGRDALEESINNINVVSLVHENLYSQSTIMVQLNKYIETLVHNIQSFIVMAKQPIVQLACDDIKLNIDQTIPLGLILNELITNSMKHAFGQLGDKPSIIKISIQEANKKINLSYQDNGIGMVANKNTNKSSGGLKLLKMLVQELQGEYTIMGSNGFEFEMSFAAKGNQQNNTSIE
jgi:two-component system, sensor histidine kinase PdtaS